jgi:hypothetical protein
MSLTQALEGFACQGTGDENAGHVADSRLWRAGTPIGMTAMITAASSYDWIWIVAVILLVVVLALGLVTIFSKTTSQSHGGVEPPRGRRRRGNPPFESVERGP